MNERQEGYVSPQDGEKLSVNQHFRDLVGEAVSNSSLLPDRYISEDESLNVLDAIENNEISTYVRSRARDSVIEAVTWLTHLYDELEEDQPDEANIEEIVDELKSLLGKFKLEPESDLE